MASSKKLSVTQVAQVAEFVREIEQKGYRSRFQLQEGLFSERQTPQRELKDCLAMWLQGDFAHEGPQKPLFLSYPFFSGMHSENIYCRFELRFEADKGIGVAKMRIELGFKQDEKLMTFRSNKEIPGLQMVPTYFKKKNPWDEHMRGRFR